MWSDELKEGAVIILDAKKKLEYAYCRLRKADKAEYRLANENDTDRLAELRWEHKADDKSLDVSEREPFVQYCSKRMKEMLRENLYCWVAVADGVIISLELLIVWPSVRSVLFYERAGFCGENDVLELSFECQTDNGSGNYTDERGEHLKDVALDDIIASIKRRKERI